MAHDLKTPLHSITTELETLRSVTDNIKTRRLSIEDGFNEANPVYDSLDSTCKFMLMAINRGLDFVKASGNVTLVPANESFCLKTAIDLAFKCIERLQSGRHVIVHELSEHVCSYVITDKHWLMENVMCLLSNAVKYSPVGASVELRLELLEIEIPEMYLPHSASDFIHVSSLSGDYGRAGTKARETAVLLVTIEDSGVGIPKKARDKLFQPFEQAQRMTGGTGLGLYSLKQRVSALGGSCGVTDRVNSKQGSRFWFTIPYRPDPDAAEDATHESAEQLVPPFSNGISDINTTVLGFNTARNAFELNAPMHTDRSVAPLRILLVDDALTILKVTSKTLKMSGHSVETAENGLESLERMKKAYELGDIDVVLTDLQMPVMDGIESTSRYRQFEAGRMVDRLTDHGGKDVSETDPNRRLIIIGMSANSDSETADEAIKAGMDGFIGKPFSYKDFEKTLMSARAVINQ